ncbi:efflux RND transporter periplasmic adaptor subunit [Fredinandcohnia humi]
MNENGQTTLQRFRSKLLIGTITCLMVFPISACSFLPKEEPVLAPPLVEPAKVEYDVSEVKKGSIVKRVKGVGSLYPVENHNLSYPESGGRISKINVKEGDNVRKGQVLAEIETGNLRFDLAQTEIELKKAEIHLKQLQNQQLDQYAIEIAKLDVQSVKNRVQHLKELLSKSQLISPLTGIVTFVGDQKAGDVIEAFQSIIQVADTSKLQLLYTAISTDVIADVKLGMSASLSSNGETLNGKVVQTPQDVPNDVIGTNEEMYKKSLLISLDKLPKDAQVGDMVDFEVITQKKDNALIIPKNALRTAMGRSYVQILDEKSKKEVDIEVGIVTDTEVEVLKGLNEGDKVILK